MLERELVERITRGDKGAFEELYEEYAQLVYRYTMSRVSNPQDAEDLTAEVFTKAWQAFPSFQWTGAPIRVWLLRIAHNLVIDTYRKRRASQQWLPETTAYQEPHFVRVEQRDVFQRATCNLSQEERLILQLFFLEEYSLKEVARYLNKTPGAIGTAKYRALRRLNLPDKRDSC